MMSIISGKNKILQLLRLPDVQEMAKLFGDLNSTQDCIGKAGSKLAIKW